MYHNSIKIIQDCNWNVLNFLQHYEILINSKIIRYYFIKNQDKEFFNEFHCKSLKFIIKLKLLFNILYKNNFNCKLYISTANFRLLNNLHRFLVFHTEHKWSIKNINNGNILKIWIDKKFKPEVELEVEICIDTLLT